MSTAIKEDIVRIGTSLTRQCQLPSVFFALIDDPKNMADENMSWFFTHIRYQNVAF
jgi:hypothetical protein